MTRFMILIIQFANRFETDQKPPCAEINWTRKLAGAGRSPAPVTKLT
jgi:hypothetical protein